MVAAMPLTLFRLRPSLTCRAATSGFAFAQRRYQDSRPRCDTYAWRISGRISFERPLSIALSRYCGTRRASATSLTDHPSSPRGQRSAWQADRIAGQLPDRSRAARRARRTHPQRQYGFPVPPREPQRRTGSRWALALACASPPRSTRTPRSAAKGGVPKSVERLTVASNPARVPGFLAEGDHRHGEDSHESP